MLDTLDDYEAAIEATLRLDFDPPAWELATFDPESFEPRDEWRRREGAYRLRVLSADIRRKLWNSPPLAREVARRADDEARRLEIELDGFAAGPLDRFPGLTSNGIWHPAIP